MRKIVSNAIRIGAVAVLARELTAAEFGVVAIAQLAVQLLAIFGSGGVMTYIIVDREPDWETRVDPAFWLNLVLTLAGCGIALAFLPVVYLIFPQRLLIEVLLVCLADYFIDQLGMIPEGLLQRRLKFRALAIRDTVRDLVIAGLSVAMALGGWGVWSLVLPSLFVAPLVVIATAVLVGYRPKLPFGRAHWRRIFTFTRSVIGQQLLIFVANEIDTAVVGRTMGDAILGIYDLAYQLANLIGRNVTAALTMVSTPALAAAFERGSGLGSPYRRMLRVLSLMTCPLLVGMFVLADDIVMIVYGPQWSAAVPLLRIFIAFTLVRSITSPTGAVFNVMNRPELSLKIVFWFLVAYIPCLVLATHWGLEVTAITVSVARIAVGMISLYISLALVGERPLQTTLELARPFAAALVMAGAVWAGREGMLAAGVPLLARALAATAVGGLVYLVMIRVVARRAFGEAVDLIKGFVRRRAR